MIPHYTKKNNKSPCNAYHIGLVIEKIAAQYLQANGCIILEHNFHCQYGEIDLICKDQNDLVFVEVRYRKNIQYGSPAATINYIKQKKIILTAQHYLSKNNWSINLPCRIDVIAISGNISNTDVEWIQNAIYV
jgi:putative endonuclease